MFNKQKTKNRSEKKNQIHLDLYKCNKMYRKETEMMENLLHTKYALNKKSLLLKMKRKTPLSCAPIYEIDRFHKWWYSIDLLATTCLSFPHWACSINIVCFKTEV